MPVPFEILANHKQSSELNLSTPVIKWKDYHLPRLTRNPMHHRTTACFLILLLLCCGLKCNTDIARVVLPEVTDTSETTPLFEMEAILATRGEVHSPIPDDVYDALWGHWTAVGLSTPRDYYTKYIDAGGIAIVGGDLVDDGIFQAARHIVLVMTAKLPGLRDALSIDTPGSIIGGDEIPFRFTLTDWDSFDAANLPEFQGVDRGDTAYWIGECGAIVCRANVAWHLHDENKLSGISRRAIVHEMAHAIHHAIVEHNLIPDFTERLDAAFISYTSDGNTCHIKNSEASRNHTEFWAHATTREWFEDVFSPNLRALEPNDWWFENCPILMNLLAEVFPAFPLEHAIDNRNYRTQENE